MIPPRRMAKSGVIWMKMLVSVASPIANATMNTAGRQLDRDRPPTRAFPWRHFPSRRVRLVAHPESDADRAHAAAAPLFHVKTQCGTTSTSTHAPAQPTHVSRMPADARDSHSRSLSSSERLDRPAKTARAAKKLTPISGGTMVTYSRPVDRSDGEARGDPPLRRSEATARSTIASECRHSSRSRAFSGLTQSTRKAIQVERRRGISVASMHCTNVSVPIFGVPVMKRVVCAEQDGGDAQRRQDTLHEVGAGVIVSRRRRADTARY